MAELVLAEDKGWDAAKVQETMREGGDNNEVVIDKKIPMHLVYFTAWVGDDGKLKTFNDIYGHEKRIALALEGKWDQIDVGRDHLAPIKGGPGASELSPTPVARQQQRRQKQPRSIVDIVGNALGGGF